MEDCGAVQSRNWATSMLRWDTVSVSRVLGNPVRTEGKEVEAGGEAETPGFMDQDHEDQLV